MRVYNVTPSTEIEYQGRMIPPDGGYVEVPNVSFIPERDRKLERDRMIAFDALPTWFIAKREAAEIAAIKAAATPVVVPEAVDTVPEPSTIGVDLAPKKTRK